MSGHVLAVVGAQYGSEGKGAVVHAIANEYTIHVRTGGPNAGHTFYHEGRKWVQQVIPCGWTNPNALMVIGRGMLLDLEILKKELDAIAEVDPTIHERLIIDERCMVLDERHHHSEGGVDGELHKRIGSTGEGVGAARIARLQRDPLKIKMLRDSVSTFGPWFGDQEGWLRKLMTRDTPGLMYEAIRNGKNVLLEGTQGSGLSLIHGPWPYVTTADTNAAQLCADAGIAPTILDQTMLVMRTYPIRVAGNSGPLYNEMTWERLSAQIGVPVEERTTVTKKVRRVGEFDIFQIREAVVLNRPTSIALTFLDYAFPTLKGRDDPTDLTEDACNYLENLEDLCDAPVVLAQTGPDTTMHLDCTR